MPSNNGLWTISRAEVRSCGSCLYFMWTLHELIPYCLCELVCYIRYLSPLSACLYLGRCILWYTSQANCLCLCTSAAMQSIGCIILTLLYSCAHTCPLSHYTAPIVVAYVCNSSLDVEYTGVYLTSHDALCLNLCRRTQEGAAYPSAVQHARSRLQRRIRPRTAGRPAESPNQSRACADESARQATRQAAGTSSLETALQGESRYDSRITR